MTLYINTSDFQRLELAIAGEVEFAYFEQDLAFNENYKTAELLENFLQASKITTDQLQRIVVCSGPGSFTGIRVGVSLAQAMGFALGIQVVALPKSKIPKNLAEFSKKKLQGAKELNYGAKPNITKSKKKTR